MSHANYLVNTRKPIDIANELVAAVKENCALKDRVGQLEVELFWMKVAERLPKGHKVLDRTPTDDMCRAAREKIGISANMADHVFRTMHDAAP